MLVCKVCPELGLQIFESILASRKVLSEDITLLLQSLADCCKVLSSQKRYFLCLTFILDGQAFVLLLEVRHLFVTSLELALLKTDLGSELVAFFLKLVYS